MRTSRTCGAATAAALAILLAAAGTAEAIVGGRQIPITAAPWTAHVITKRSTGTNTCTGSIIDATRVITAAHCVPTLGETPQVTIVAGSSNVADPGQGVRVPAAGIRIHPYSVQALQFDSDDDVAVVTLQRPLDFSGPAIQPIGLVPPGPAPATGTPVLAIGYGRQSPSAEPDGQLYALPHSLRDPYAGHAGFACATGGFYAAVYLCPQSDTGATCFGDSGGPLVVGSPPLLAGVASRGTGVRVGGGATESCVGGRPSGFVNLSAPEIRAFIDGNDQPPRAPQLDGSFIVKQVGRKHHERLVCDSDPWRNEPALSYAWIDVRTGRTIATGASYPLKRRDLGRELTCVVTASNAGGITSTDGGTQTVYSFMVPELSRKQQRRHALKACRKKHTKAARTHCRKRVLKRFRRHR